MIHLKDLYHISVRYIHTDGKDILIYLAITIKNQIDSSIDRNTPKKEGYKDNHIELQRNIP